MFTGLVDHQGKLLSEQSLEAGKRLVIEHAFGELALGESIAVSGPCLTVVESGPRSFAVDVSTETLERTTLGEWAPGRAVNLERSLALGERLGGHLVTGHIDGVGQVVRALSEGDMVKLTLEVPSALAPYVAEKGSISVDGVSLTVNRAEGRSLDLLVIPHTLEVTTLGLLEVGSRVNIEVDLVARYVERLLQAR